MISPEMPTDPLPKSQEEGKRDDLVPFCGESLLPTRTEMPENKGVSSLQDFAEHFQGQDFGACSSALLQELKGVEETDLLPLLVGLLGHIGASEFADQADHKQKRRGAFSKSVASEQSGQSTKVPESEAFRRLRRAAFSSDAKTLVSHELGERVDTADVSGSDILGRFGFLEGRCGSADLRRAMNDETADERSLTEEPCGF